MKDALRLSPVWQAFLFILFAGCSLLWYLSPAGLTCTNANSPPSFPNGTIIGRTLFTAAMHICHLPFAGSAV